MERSKIIENITTYLATFVTKVKAEGSLNLHNSNIDAEYFLCEFLNNLYGLKLINANDEFLNEGGIDLVDKEEKIVFQVTSKASVDKISHSFETANKEKYKDFRFRFFFIEESNVVASLRNSKAKGLQSHSFVFDKAKDILDIKLLESEIGSKSIEELQKLEGIAKKHIMPMFTCNDNQVVINISNGSVEISKEIADSVEEHLNNYIERFRDKYSKISTLLHPNKVPFYNVYYPLSIESHDGLVIKIEDNVSSAFLNDNKIVIVGTAGAGKTMLMKHCFLSAMNSNLVPVMIVFREMEETDSFVSYVKDKIFGFDHTGSDSPFYKMMSSGQFLFILDGFDEVPAKDIKRRFREINNFVDASPSNNYILTTRPGTEAQKLDRFQRYEICDLEGDDIEKFAQKQCESIEEMSSSDEIIRALESDHAKQFREYFSNPLLLSMFIMTYSRHPEIPTKKSDFYRNVIDQLLYKHDSSKGVYRHEHLSRIETDSQFVDILERLSYDTYFTDKYNIEKNELEVILEGICNELGYECSIEGLIYDLTTSICILIEDDGVFSYPHRSIQEYFVTLLVQKQETREKQWFYEHEIIGGYAIREQNGLWSLLDEMDTRAFKSFFVIPSLEDFFQLFPDGTDICDTFNRIIEIFIEISTKSKLPHLAVNSNRDKYIPHLAVNSNRDKYIPLFDYLHEDPVFIVYHYLHHINERLFVIEKEGTYINCQLNHYTKGEDKFLDETLEELAGVLVNLRGILNSAKEYVEKENKSIQNRFGKPRTRFGR